jgi:hypothetical protein
MLLSEKGSSKAPCLVKHVTPLAQKHAHQQALLPGGLDLRYSMDATGLELQSHSIQ